MQSGLVKCKQDGSGGGAILRPPSCKRRRIKLGDHKEEALPLPFLSDDELLEILVRLPVDSLHRFKCVSKHWLSLFSDLCFIARYKDIRSKANYLPPLRMRDHLALYFVRYFHGPDLLGDDFGHVDLSLSDVLSWPWVFDSSFRFLPVMRDRPGPLKRRQQSQYCLNDLLVLGASHGLLFCKVCFKRRLKPTRPSCFYICNPLTKQWLEVPPLPRRYTISVGPTVWSVANCGAGFTIVEAEDKNITSDDHFVAHVFSSKSGSWAIHRVACHPPGAHLWWSKLSFSVASHNGVFYWDGKTRVVMYDLLNRPNECDLIHYPPGMEFQPHGFNVSTAGKLRIIYACRGVFTVWELDNNNYKEGQHNHCQDPHAWWSLLYNVMILHTGLDFGYFNQHILCLAKLSAGQLVLFNLEDGSLLGAFPIGVADDEAKRRGFVGLFTLPFYLTPWPTPIPQLPHHV